MGLLLQENTWTTKHQGTEGPMQRALGISYSCRNSTTILLPKQIHLAWVQCNKGGYAWEELLHNPSCTGKVAHRGAAGGSLPLRCTAQRSYGC